VSRQNPFAMHYQLVWQGRSGDRRLPLWLRVVALAYGMHRANGHASFAPGQIAFALTTVDPDTGEAWKPTRQAVHRATRDAIEYGWLASRSSTRCLVVPEHAISGGLGHAWDTCKWHAQKGDSDARTS